MINDRADGNMPLDDYPDSGRFCTNCLFYTDRQANIIADHVVKYETLVQDLMQLFTNLGIPFAGSPGGRAKSELCKDRKPYAQVFTGQQRRCVEEAFAREIEMHQQVY